MALLEIQLSKPRLFSIVVDNPGKVAYTEYRNILVGKDVRSDGT